MSRTSPYHTSAAYAGAGLMDVNALTMHYTSPYMHELAYLDVPTTTPGRLGMPIGTPRTALIDPPLF